VCKKEETRGEGGEMVGKKKRGEGENLNPEL
jgi:hypothetical protein